MSAGCQRRTKRLGSRHAGLLETAKQKITDLHSSAGAGHHFCSFDALGVLTDQWSDRKHAQKRSVKSSGNRVSRCANYRHHHSVSGREKLGLSSTDGRNSTERERSKPQPATSALPALTNSIRLAFAKSISFNQRDPGAARWLQRLGKPSLLERAA
jgi:hypothetical protein